MFFVYFYDIGKGDVNEDSIDVYDWSDCLCLFFGLDFLSRRCWLVNCSRWDLIGREVNRGSCWVVLGGRGI